MSITDAATLPLHSSRDWWLKYCNLITYYKSSFHTNRLSADFQLSPFFKTKKKQRENEP